MFQKKSNQTRLIFKLNNKFRKILWFSPDKKDHSMYMGIYSKEEQSIKYAGKINKQPTPITIKYDDLNRLSTNFIPNKISFHQSGYIGVTNKNGDRFEDGMVNIPFIEVDTYTRLAIIGLRNPETFPEATHKDIDNPWSAIIDVDTFPRKPYILHLFLTKKGLDPTFIQKEEGYFGFLSMEGKGIKYDVVWVFSEPKETKDWSPYTLLFTFNRT